MATRAITGTARHLHLARAARNAGEAFAFVEADGAERSPFRIPSLGLIWSAIGLIAAAALFLGL